MNSMIYFSLIFFLIKAVHIFYLKGDLDVRQRIIHSWTDKYLPKDELPVSLPPHHQTHITNLLLFFFVDCLFLHVDLSCKSHRFPASIRACVQKVSTLFRAPTLMALKAFWHSEANKHTQQRSDETYLA